MPTQCPGSQFAVRGRTGQIAPGGGKLRLRLSEPLAHVRGGGCWKSPLRHAFGMTPPPKGEARLGSPFGGRYVPVGRCPAADRGGSRDAGTAPAVTERAARQRFHTAHVQGPLAPCPLR